MQSDSQAKDTASIFFKALLPNLLGLLLVLAVLSAFFYKSVFLGLPIAKLGTLPCIDALFNPANKNAITDIGADPSGYLIFFPNGHFENSCWWKLVIPLWNPLVACGYPLLGDPQSFFLSPAHLLGLFRSPESYNFGLLLEIALGGISSYLLARYLRLSIAASVFASLAYVLSPRVLSQIDIAGNECLFPFVFLGFAYLARRPCVLRALLAGLICALAAFAIHPETVFFAVLSGAVFSFFLIAFSAASGQSGAAYRQALLKGAARGMSLLLLTAAVSLLLALPLISPFLEFMRNAYVYKDGSGLVSVAFPQFFMGFYAADGTEAFFIGSVAALLVPLGIVFGERRKALAISLTLILAAFVCLPSGPVLQFLSMKPYCYLATLYGIPDMLLLLSLLAAMGFDSLSQRPVSKQPALLFLSTLIVIAFPIQQVQSQIGAFDLSRLWQAGHALFTSTSIPALISFLIILVMGASVNSRLRKIGFALLLCLNFLSLALISKKVLPVNPSYSMEAPAPLEFLRSTQSRSLSTGGNFFLTNASMNYGVSDLRCFSPLLPLRYQKFLLAAGARCYNLYFYNFPDYCSPLLDLASVKYVMTRGALRAEDDHIFAPSRLILPDAGNGHIMPGLRILSAGMTFDAQNSQVDADLQMRIHDLCNYRYALQYCVYDAAARELWSSREQLISPAEGKLHQALMHESWPIPLSARYPISLVLKVKDTWTSSYVKPAERQAQFNDAFLLTRIEKKIPKKEAVSCSHFKLEKEFPQSACRIYKNQRALPSAYLVGKVKHPASGVEPSPLLLKSINAWAEAIIEDGPEARTSGNAYPVIREMPVERPDSNTLIVRCNAESDCYLVLTDTYYPGWKCYVDAKETPVYAANYLFRGVALPKGEHRVKFVFSPPSFFNSMVISLLLFLSLIVAVYARRQELLDKDGGL
ncbi:MAG: YfhO family protein [Candidatus Obscuribacterales bacterium]|nr:YfhO family protein [Candidatus Obscuribacterales bacterium]